MSNGDPAVEQAVYDFLASRHEYHESELEPLRGSLIPVRFNHIVWEAKQRLRADRAIEFVPVFKEAGDSGGQFVRASDPQKLNRGKKFAKTGLRKQRRSLAVLDAVDEGGLSPDQKADLNFSKEKIGNAVTRASQAMSMRRPPITVCEVPDVPRRRSNGT